jgi:hypothetical protein
MIVFKYGVYKEHETWGGYDYTLGTSQKGFSMMPYFHTLVILRGRVALPVQTIGPVRRTPGDIGNPTSPGVAKIYVGIDYDLPQDNNVIINKNNCNSKKRSI